MIRILVIDDHERFRERVVALLASSPGFAVAGEAGSGHAALDMLAAGLEVDVMLTDLRMPGLDGIELMRRALALRPGLRVLVLSSYDAPALVAAAAAAGASGHVLKGEPPDRLLHALREVGAGRCCFASDLGNSASQSPHPADTAEPPPSTS